MVQSPYNYDRERLRIVRESGWIIEDLCGVTRIPSKEMYEILAGLYDPPESAKSRMAAALGCEVGELFPQNGNQG